MIIWFTGQPGAGKTTLSLALQEYLVKQYKMKTFRLDGDDLRRMSCNKDYSPIGRRLNVKTAMDIALALDTNDTVIICALVSPYRDQREWLKWNGNVVEMFLTTKRHDSSKPAPCADYQPPMTDYLHVDTDLDPVACIERIIGYIHDDLAFSIGSSYQGGES
jgi:adenylylsulfate kinase